jgi:hypothetical protein
MRRLAVVGIAVGLGLVGSLFLLPHFPSLGSFLREPRAPSLNIDLPVGLAMLVLTPIVLGFALRRQRPTSVRGVVALGLITTAVLVGNLLLLAIFPGVVETLESVVGISFWKIHGLLVVLAGFSLLGVVVGACQLRPFSVRRLVQFGVIAGAILTFDLVVIALRPSIIDGLQRSVRAYHVFDASDGELLGQVVLAVGVAALPPLVLLIAAWRWRLQSWRWIAGGGVVLALGLVYLARDDRVIRRPTTIAEISPPFPGAAESNAVLMRYGNKHPLGRDFRRPGQIWQKPIAVGEAFEPGKPVEWQAWLTHHRTDVEADWNQLAPVRAWWTELNAFDRIGDLTPATFDAEIVAFAPIRAMSQDGCAIASLQALDGHGDDAIATLLPILQVGRKLQPSARTLVRQMIAIVVERMSLDTATFVLDHATVSPAARAQLAAVLAADGGGPAGARHLIAIEYAIQLELTRDKSLGDLMVGAYSGWWRRGLNAISPFVFNPRATFNVYGDFVADEQDFVANRQFDQLAARTKIFLNDEARPHFKNFAGALLMGAATPAMSKIAQTYWKAQDARAALLARVTRS